MDKKLFSDIISVKKLPLQYDYLECLHQRQNAIKARFEYTSPVLQSKNVRKTISEKPISKMLDEI